MIKNQKLINLQNISSGIIQFGVAMYPNEHAINSECKAKMIRSNEVFFV